MALAGRDLLKENATGWLTNKQTVTTVSNGRSTKAANRKLGRGGKGGGGGGRENGRGLAIVY